MSKRQNPDNKSTSAAKRIGGPQNENCASSPEEKMFVYHQGYINVKSLFLAGKLADVHFMFDSDDGTTTCVPAHRILLALTSDVFEKMFCDEMKENGDVKIVDASAAAFREFLQFFYLSKVKLSAEHLASVLYLGSKYNVGKCTDACIKFLTDNLSNENVCVALSSAISLGRKKLTRACEKRIILNTADVFKSAGFLASSKETLSHILAMNRLPCSELELFEACMDWVQAKSKEKVVSKAAVEEHLGDLYSHIRLTSTTPEEFLTLESKYSADLLSDLESTVHSSHRDGNHSGNFNKSHQHQMKWTEDEDTIIACDRDNIATSYSWHFLDNEEKTTFTVSVPLLLGSFTCNKIFFEKSEPQDFRSIDVQITEARTLDDATDAKVLCSTIMNLGFVNTKISLPHAVLIRPGFSYTICIKGFSQGHHFRSLEQERSVNLGSNIKIEFHNDKTVDGKMFGLIYALDFINI